MILISIRQIQQMNQRGTHFQLGSTSQNYQSIYHKDYPKKNHEKNDVAVTNPFRSNSLASHDKGTFSTTNKVLLKAWDHAQIAKLDQAKLHELKSHHFKLGNYNPQEAATTHKVYYDKKQITSDASKNQEESKKNMRGHHHDFKEQNHTNYKSAYSGQFTPKDWNPVGQVVQGGQNAICFGTQALPKVTVNHSSFTPKEAQRVKANPQPALGVNLGDMTTSMETMNQQYFDRKEIRKASLPESTMKELRGTHFGMGQSNLNYQTENHNYRNAPGKSQNKYDFKMPTYEVGSWNDKNAKFNGQTTSKRELPQRDVKPFERVSQFTRNGMNLGGHSGNYTTQFKNRFTQQKPVQNTVDANKQSSVVIGGNGRFYSTQQKSSYQTNNLKEGRIDVDIKKLNSEDHFQIGGQAVDPGITVFKDEFRSDVDKRNKVFHKSNQKRQ